MTDDKRLLGSLESILFTMGNAVEIQTIANALSVEETEVPALVEALNNRYAETGSGLQIIQLEEAYQMCTREEFYDVLIKIASEPLKPILTEVMLEVLSIIAYRQPTTRGEIEKIRGVSSDYAINRLIEYGLIEEAGRLDAPGRPILFKTTEEFLRKFGLSSVRELPAFDDLTSDAMEEVYRHTGFDMEGQLSLDLLGD